MLSFLVASEVKQEANREPAKSLTSGLGSRVLWGNPREDCTNVGTKSVGVEEEGTTHTVARDVATTPP